MTTAKLKNGAVTGSKIDLGSLGVVPAADTATQAANASALAGSGPDSYLDRVAQLVREGPVLRPAGAQVDLLASGALELTVPTGVGFVEVEGWASLNSAVAPDDFLLWIEQDRPCTTPVSSQPNRDGGSYNFLPTSEQQTFSQRFVFAVAPGRHGYRLCAALAAELNLLRGNLIVRTIARGANGE